MKLILKKTPKTKQQQNNDSEIKEREVPAGAAVNSWGCIDLSWSLGVYSSWDTEMPLQRSGIILKENEE